MNSFKAQRIKFITPAIIAIILFVVNMKYNTFTVDIIRAIYTGLIDSAMFVYLSGTRNVVNFLSESKYKEFFGKKETKSNVIACMVRLKTLVREGVIYIIASNVIMCIGAVGNDVGFYFWIGINIYGAYVYSLAHEKYYSIMNYMHKNKFKF